MKILFVIAILAVAFASSISLYFLLATPLTSATTTLSGNEIAVDSLKFINVMKNNDGKYYYQSECTDDSGCKRDSDSYIQTGAWPVLAYAGLYQSTKNQQYLDKMNNEANNLMSACNGNEDECMWILVQMAKAYQISQNSQYLDFAKKLADRLLTNNNEKDAMMTGIEAREFALAYELTGDQKYLNEARSRLQKSKAAWNLSVDSYNDPIYSSGTFVLYRFACWTELAELEIAKASSDTKILANAVAFFDSANIPGNVRNLEQLSAIQPCIEALLNLNQQTGSAQYFDQAKATSQYVITYRWDSPLDIAKKYNGDGAYLFRFYAGDDLKTVTDTGYMIYLLSRMPNEQFEILSWR